MHVSAAEPRMRVVRQPQFPNNFSGKKREFAAVYGKFSGTWERIARFLNKPITFSEQNSARNSANPPDVPETGLSLPPSVHPSGITVEISPAGDGTHRHDGIRRTRRRASKSLGLGPDGNGSERPLKRPRNSAEFTQAGPGNLIPENRVVREPQFPNNFPEKTENLPPLYGKFSGTWEGTARFLNKSDESDEFPQIFREVLSAPSAPEQGPDKPDRAAPPAHTAPLSFPKESSRDTASLESVFEPGPAVFTRVVQKSRFPNNFPEKNREFAAMSGKFSGTWERTARFLNTPNNSPAYPAENSTAFSGPAPQQGTSPVTPVDSPGRLSADIPANSGGLASSAAGILDAAAFPAAAPSAPVQARDAELERLRRIEANYRRDKALLARERQPLFARSASLDMERADEGASPAESDAFAIQRMNDRFGRLIKEALNESL
jgi:hypothetical protein